VTEDKLKTQKLLKTILSVWSALETTCLCVGMSTAVTEPPVSSGQPIVRSSDNINQSSGRREASHPDRRLQPGHAHRYRGNILRSQHLIGHRSRGPDQSACRPAVPVVPHSGGNPRTAISCHWDSEQNESREKFKSFAVTEIVFKW